MKGNRKKYTGWLWPIFVLAALLLTGCKAKGGDTITGVIFDRGHGSMWGNQFYIELVAEEIVLARYFPQNSQEQQVSEHLPITAEQWTDICTAVQALELKEDRPSLLDKLFRRSKLDGGETRTLTLIWDGETKITYQWPNDPRAMELEALLERLVVLSE